MHCQRHTRPLLVSYTLLALAFLPRGDLTEATSCSDLCHYVPWARDADCSRRALHSVPVECLDSKTLNLNKNNITEVPSRAFSSFGHLKYLQMLENHMHMISPNAFAGAPRLKCVNLLKNSLITIPLHAFNDTASLKWIYMSRNRITAIERGVFQETSSIEMLYLDNNQLKDLDPDVFSGLSMMQRLLLGDNQMRALPDGLFRDMTRLDYLDLSRNNLRTLSVTAFAGLGSLQIIKLSGNELVDIVPGTFARNPIAYLDISGNRLTKLSWDESDFDGLEEIEAAGNDWFCDCSLDPFRAVLLDLSLGADSTVVCAGPESIAHTDIVSHSTLCPTPTPQPPPDKTTIKRLINRVDARYHGQQGSDTTEDVLQVAFENSPVKITLIAVVIITFVALTGMAVFLFVIVILPRVRRDRKYSDPVKTTNGYVEVAVPEKANPAPV